MATDQRNQQPTPPKPGTRPSVRVDDQLAADLADIMRTGVNMSDAIRRAAGHLADVYRVGWANGVCPEGTAPQVLAYQLHQQPTPEPTTSGYDEPSATSDTRPPHLLDRRLASPPPGRHLPTAYAETLLGRRTPPQRPDAQRPARA
ncbi:hypothetical protein [Streptomyces silvensis]|uniref:Uncharacterized protein n=1 Tax=Streptomyces silvensis TaxID=1765722 RepID=A0A0W7X9X7_9ACTN|nr:hypothetical protein [Streptomyces silvensis]KUF19579.1 hypothetical protein AT728_04185 [Streptomyces silvensis]